MRNLTAEGLLGVAEEGTRVSDSNTRTRAQVPPVPPQTPHSSTSPLCKQILGHVKRITPYEDSVPQHELH